MIKLEGVSKTYSVSAAAVEALRGVTLSIDRGEYVAVLGPSGSGKSTLMHIIGCLDTPTSGSYFLEGASVGDLSRDELADIRSRWIGFVFQSFHLLPQATATENVELPLVFANVPAQRRHQRAEELLDRVELGQVVLYLGCDVRPIARADYLGGGDYLRRDALARLPLGEGLHLLDEVVRRDYEVLRIVHGFGPGVRPGLRTVPRLAGGRYGGPGPIDRLLRRTTIGPFAALMMESATGDENCSGDGK